jgi:hypothetical protein
MFQAGSVAAYEHSDMIKLHYSVADALDECIQKLDKSEMAHSNRRAVLVVPEAKTIQHESPLGKKRFFGARVASKNVLAPVASYHDESDEDEIEREWVNRSSQTKGRVL